MDIITIVWILLYVVGLLMALVLFTNIHWFILCRMQRRKEASKRQQDDKE